MNRYLALALPALSTVLLAACRPPAAQPAPEGLAVASAPAGQGPAVSGGAEWPRFRGPNNDGISPEKGVNKDWKTKPPALLWKASMGDDGYAGPSVAGGMVYIIDHSGSEDVVRALKLTDGSEAWRYKYADVAQANYGFARATPTVDGGKVYVLGRMGQLVCLDAKAGQVVWQRNLVKEFGARLPGWQLAGSVLIDGQKAILNIGAADGSVLALDKATGKPIWKGGGTEMAGYSTPVIATIGGRRQYVLMTGTSVIGVDPQSGALIWRAPWQTSYDVNACTPIVIGDSVFVSSGYGHGCGLVDVKGSQAQFRWQNTQIQAHFSTPVVSGGMIYGTGDPGVLVCLDPATGRALWRQPGFEKGGVCAVEGTIIAMNGSNGDTIMAKLDASGYQELGRITPLGGQSWTAPIVAQGRLIVRNKSTLACLDLR